MDAEAQNITLRTMEWKSPYGEHSLTGQGCPHLTDVLVQGQPQYELFLQRVEEISKF